MRKTIVVIIIAILTLNLGINMTQAEILTPNEKDKYYKYMDRYLHNKPDDTEYTFIRTKWIQKHHDKYVSGLSDKDKKNFNSYVFANPKVDKDGKAIVYENEIISHEVWKRNSRHKPKEGEEYLIVNIEYKEDGVKINEIRDIWRLEVEIEKEYKPDCQVKIKKNSQGKVKRHVTCNA